MRDNRHYKAEKRNGFWDFVIQDPGDYIGRHRLDEGRGHKAGQIWLSCSICLEGLKA